MIGYMILDKNKEFNFEINKYYGSIIPCLYFNSYRFFECPYEINDNINFIIENKLEIVMIEILGCCIWADSSDYYYGNYYYGNYYYGNMLTNRIKIIKKIDIDNLFDLYKDGEHITQFGDKYRFKNKKLNSDNDEPALIIYRNGECIKKWYKDGVLHRDNNMPAVIDSLGYKSFYSNGKFISNNNNSPGFSRFIVPF